MDDIEVTIISGLGSYYGKIFMPRKMKEGLIKTYIESGAIKSVYMFVDGKEITDGKKNGLIFHI